MPVYPKRGRKGPNGEPVWRIVVWSNGQSHEKTFTGPKKEANAAEARWKVELASAAAPPRSSSRGPVDLLTFSRGDYATHAKAHLPPRTWAVRRHQLAALCGAYAYEDGDGRKVTVNLGATKLTALTTEVVDRYKAARLALGKKPRTINTELAKLRAVLTYAKDLGVPCASPKIKALPVIGRGRVTFWNAEQLDRLFAAVEEEAFDLLPIVVFIANTGCRKGEALACEQAWIDLERGMITIQPNPYWQPKDDEPREIPISDVPIRRSVP